MKLKVVTPERVLMEQEVEGVTVPTQSGEITILKHHIPLVSNLKAGEVRISKSDGVEFMSVSGGFVEVRDTGEVIILSDTAEFGHEIDINRAEKARVAAQKLMQENAHDEVLSADALAILEKNMARLKVGKKHRTHTSHNLESGVLKE